MFDRLKAACPRVADRIAHRWFRARYHLARLSRAWAYFRDRLDADEAQRIMLDCEYPAGWHPLLVLTVEDALEQAREIFADHPDLPRLINDGCARVASKWESYNDELYEARRWATDLAADYAVAEGVILTRLEAVGDHAASDTEGDDHTAVSKEGGAP
ncbi:hypothetical protein [Thiobacillus sedimenti]|uniref:Uncharacterized protein n=1 Tax=Thiobacillus sedimenti TaxID=3110231 RepID=A0ABZ1CGC6_9PROT|nr:hypothetical protein [Thiobacillus sp. SCUT-2]WRS38150.1 hypothetical protein VA613_08995 [Thiobacillus sp. SCUT-2]